MRLGRRNKQKIKYALLKGSEPVYILDNQGNRVVDYIDEQGRIFYKQTGTKELVYANPKDAYVNIAFSSGETQAVEFGIDDSNYDASLVYMWHEYPISETTLIWYNSAPKFKGTGANRKVDPNSADFKVLYVKDSLNFTKVLLGKLVK